MLLLLDVHVFEELVEFVMDDNNGFKKKQEFILEK
jgi:hypothetical protein